MSGAEWRGLEETIAMETTRKHLMAKIDKLLMDTICGGYWPPPNGTLNYHDFFPPPCPPGGWVVKWDAVA